MSPQPMYGNTRRDPVADLQPNRSDPLTSQHNRAVVYSTGQSFQVFQDAQTSRLNQRLVN